MKANEMECNGDDGQVCPPPRRVKRPLLPHYPEMVPVSPLPAPHMIINVGPSRNVEDRRPGHQKRRSAWDFLREVAQGVRQGMLP